MKNIAAYFPMDPLLRMLYVQEPGIPKKYYDGRHAMLLREFRYLPRMGNPVVADSGFVFDGGTIPRWCWSVIGGPFEFALPAYIIHDWLCDNAEAHPKEYDQLRFWADQTFYDILIILGYSKAKAGLMYEAVRTAA